MQLTPQEKSVLTSIENSIDYLTMIGQEVDDIMHPKSDVRQALTKAKKEMVMFKREIIGNRKR